MSRWWVFMLSFALLVPGTLVLAGGETDSYQANMQRDLVRGLKNIVSAPVEIPLTIQEYRQNPGRDGIREMAGFFDGVFQTISRAGSGIWDLFAAFIPGQQEGLPVSPETLF